MGRTRINRTFDRIVSAGQPWWYLLRLLAFWLLFFTLFRIWFIVWLHKDWGTESPWAALWQGLPLDLSMAGYLMLLPVLFWFAGLVPGTSVRPFFQKLTLWFNVGVFAVFIFVFGANIFIYEEWHTPLNNRALEYFRTPAAMLDSMSLGFKLGSLAAYAGLAWLWWRIYRFVVGKADYREKPSLIHLAWLPALIAVLLLAIRGGVGKMPINESAVYYSAHPFNNHAATNTAWHVIHSLVETRSTENHFRAMDDASARKQTEALYPGYTPSSRLHSWLALPGARRPNIVFIIMESMTAQVMAELGGEPDLCPNLSQLASEGLLFDSCYSSGYRTDQGLVAVLGGFPAQPDQSVVLLQDKAARLPSVPKILKGNGYATAFLYGGQLTFANIGVWLRNQQFEHIISGKDFSSAELTQRWGADDSQVFNRASQTFRQLPEPFFGAIMTLSLHSPYDVPYESKWNGPSEREKFLNSAAFADHAIGAFFQKARQEPWYANTLFVLVADHGHQQPGGIRMDDPRSRQVPLIITGPLIAPDWRGRRIGKLGNHHDIPATILDELGFSAASFTWSKDLLNPASAAFAYYSNENGLGWINPSGAGFFRFEQQHWQCYPDCPDRSSLVNARAYLQTLYNDFLGL